jgi:hypothetical protein
MLLFLSNWIPAQNGVNAGGVAEVVEHLPCKQKFLNSNPSTAKKGGGGAQKGITYVYIFECFPCVSL